MLETLPIGKYIFWILYWILFPVIFIVQIIFFPDYLVYSSIEKESILTVKALCLLKRMDKCNSGSDSIFLLHSSVLIFIPVNLYLFFWTEAFPLIRKIVQGKQLCISRQKKASAILQKS